MSDFAKALRLHAASDHKRGCQGRCYSCECGHDTATDQRLLEAADEIDRLHSTIIRIDAINDNPAHFSAEINAVCDTILRPDLAPNVGSVSTPEVKP